MISIIAQPSATQTLSNSRVAFLVESDQTAQLEFSYLMEIEADGVVLSTRRLSPNANTHGDFEVGSILATVTSPEFAVFNDFTTRTASTSVALFTPTFHEEFLVNGILTRGASVQGTSFSIVDGVAAPLDQDAPAVIRSIKPDNLPTNHRLHVTSDLVVTLIGDGWSYSINGGALVAVTNPTNVLNFLHVGPLALDQIADYTIDFHVDGSSISVKTLDINVYTSRSYLGELELHWWNDTAWHTYIADQEGTEQIAAANETADQQSSRTTLTGFSNREETGNRVLLGDSRIFKTTITKPETKQTGWFSSQEDADYFASIYDSGSHVYRKIGSNLEPLILTTTSRGRKPIQRAPGQFNHQLAYTSALNERQR